MSAQQITSITLVGAGTVGCLLALALAEANVEVTLIDASLPGQQQQGQGFDSRSIALSYDSFQRLKTLSFGHLLSKHVTAIKHIQVSDQGHLGQTRLDNQSLGIQALGYVVELDTLGKILHQSLADTSSVNWLRGVAVTQVRQQRDSVKLVLADGQCLTSQLVVATDGVNSSVKQLLDLATDTQHYSQSAIIANVATEAAHQGQAFERFTAAGPLAMLPMADADGRHRCSLVWCLPSEQSQSMLDASEQAFAADLQQAFGDRLGKITHVGQRSCYPLSLSRNRFMPQHRILFVGNASQTIHPIAGQGFNLAVRDVFQLVKTLKQASQSAIQSQHALDLGAVSILRDYETARKPDRERVIATTDGLLRMFSNQHLPLVAARNLGLLAMQCVSPIKHRFARTMMGLQ